MRYVTFQEFRKYVRGSMAAFLVMLAAIGGVLSTKPDTDSLRAGLVSSCDRVNILRAQSNLSDNVSFSLLSIAGQREAALGKPGKSDSKLHRTSAALLFDQAEQLTITSLTLCGPAVNSARKYKIPTAIRIGDARTGKRSQLASTIIMDSRRLLRITGNSTTTSG